MKRLTEQALTFAVSSGAIGNVGLKNLVAQKTNLFDWLDDPAWVGPLNSGEVCDVIVGGGGGAR